MHDEGSSRGTVSKKYSTHMCESWVLLLNLFQLLVRLDTHNVLRVSAHTDQVGHTLKHANICIT